MKELHNEEFLSKYIYEELFQNYNVIHGHRVHEGFTIYVYILHFPEGLIQIL